MIYLFWLALIAAYICERNISFARHIMTMECAKNHELSRAQTYSLATLLTLAYMAFGILLGLTPQIYPEEAKKRGAVSAEVQ